MKMISVVGYYQIKAMMKTIIKLGSYSYTKAWVDETSSKILNLPVGDSYFPEWKPKNIKE